MKFRAECTLYDFGCGLLKKGTIVDIDPEKRHNVHLVPVEDAAEAEKVPVVSSIEEVPEEEVPEEEAVKEEVPEEETPKKSAPKKKNKRK